MLGRLIQKMMLDCVVKKDNALKTNQQAIPPPSFYNKTDENLDACLQKISTHFEKDLVEVVRSLLFINSSELKNIERKIESLD